MNSTYSINMGRLLLLLRNSLIINRSLVFIIVAVFSALIVLGRIADAFSGDAPYSYGNMFFLLLYISGLFLTISINREIHDKKKSNTWLLLPASTLEKFIALLVLPTLLLAAGLTIYMTIASHILEFVIAAFFSTDINGFNPFSMDMFKRIGVYIAIQAPFLAGAIYFRKYAMSLTFLFLFIWGAIFSIFAFFTGKLFLGDYIAPILPGFSFIGGAVELGDIDTLYATTLLEKLKYAMDFWKPLATIYYWFLSPLLWWIIAFFSSKEMEQ